MTTKTYADRSAADPIQAVLEPSEEIVWRQAGPRLRLSLPLLIPLIFSVAWTGAALAFVGLMLMLAWQTPEPQNIATGFVIAAVLVSVGLFFVSYSWHGLRAGLSTEYAVTDRAALIIETVGRPRVRRFNASDIEKRERFGDRIGFMPDIVDGNSFDATTSFIGIRDMAAVEAALDTIVQSTNQSNDTLKRHTS